MSFRHLARATAHAALLGLAITVCGALPASAQKSILDQIDSCNGSKGAPADTRIAACTAIIDSGLASDHGLAIAYNERGLARISKQELDKAIEDFSAAI